MANYDTSIRVNTNVDNADLNQLEKKFDKLNEKLENLRKKGDKMEALGVSKQSKQWKAWRYDVAQAEGNLYEVEEAINSINATKPQGAFAKLKDSAVSFFRSVKDGSEESNSLIKTMGSRLKGIALSLLVFNWITKGFNAMVSAMKSGFHNLAQYSSDYNAAMSDLKSECVQVKNSLAVAFEPVVTAIIPYITQLISWINTAANAVAKFLAVLQGKSTYTQAKKQVIDYAKSLKSASDTAKGALAAFDSINVLSSDSGSESGSGGETAGADAFENVQVNPEDLQMLDVVREKLQEILNILIPIGLAMAVFGIGGPLGIFAGVLITVIGLLEFILSYMDAWANGISFDNLTGMLLGLLGVVLGIYMLFGKVPAAIALVIGAIALIVLAIKDMIENGVNMQNGFMLILGVVGLLIGVFVLFGSTAALVVGGIIAVVGILAALINVAGNGEEAISSLKSMCKNFADFFSKIFAGDIEGAMESLKEAGKDLANVFIITLESLINCFIKGLNWLIEKINSISFDVPDWVPAIGGEKLSPNIPTIKEVDLPRLAESAVIQGGRPFAAVLGDQRFGQTNIETPLETTIEAFKQAHAEVGANNGYRGPVYMQLDGKTFAKLEMPYFEQESNRIGVSFKTTGGIL